MKLFEYDFLLSLGDTMKHTGEAFIWGCALVAGVLILINWVSER